MSGITTWENVFVSLRFLKTHSGKYRQLFVFTSLNVSALPVSERLFEQPMQEQRNLSNRFY